MLSIIDAPQAVGAHAHDLVRTGVETVIRHHAPGDGPESPSTPLTRDEADALSEAGLTLATVYPDGGRPLDDFGTEAGHRDAGHALDRAHLVGQPGGSGIYFAVGEDYVGSNAMHRILTHFEAIRDTFGADYRVGALGSGHVLRQLLDERLIDLAWLSHSAGWTDHHAFLASHDWTLRQTGQRVWPRLDFPYVPNQANPAFPDFGQFRLGQAMFRPRVPRFAGLLMRVTARRGLNLRRGPGAEFDVIETLPRDTVVHVELVSGDWARVDLDGDGAHDGYVHCGFLDLLTGGEIPQRTGLETPYDIARQEMRMGVRSRPGRENNPRILLYHASTTSGAPDVTPWCSSFVNWCVTQAGLEGTDSKWAMSWHDTRWGRAVTDEPRPGDIAVYKRHYAKRDGTTGIGGHVGFVVQVDDDTIALLGANNRSNHATVAQYPRHGGTVWGQRYDLLSVRRPYL